MDAWQPLDRRTFLADMGKGAFALAIVGLAGCGPTAVATSQPAQPSDAGSSGATPESATAATVASSGTPPPSGPGGAFNWARVSFGFVSAYILVRAGEAAVVDTGVAGSADEIESALGGVGLDWSNVGHLILTHHHGDHVGSAAEIIDRAPGVMTYAGAEDIPSISVPREPSVATDGDQVFGLQIVATPGHTAGSISVLEPVAGILVAGDALRTEGGKPALPSAQFTVDMNQAKQSIVKLGSLQFETLLVGHGEPLEGGASAAVAELAAA